MKYRKAKVFNVIGAEFKIPSDEVADLYSIAIQCPMSGGPSVYQARAIYSVIDPDQQYDDPTICFQSGIALRKPKLSSFSSAYIYPNPATEKATLVYNLTENGSLVIYDALGQSKLFSKLDGEKQELIFDTGDLANGVYFYSVICNGENISAGKLVITKQY